MQSNAPSDGQQQSLRQSFHLGSMFWTLSMCDVNRKVGGAKGRRGHLQPREAASLRADVSTESEE